MRITLRGGDDQFSRVLREVREVQRQAPLGNSSVSRGRTRFIGLLSLLVEGSARVTGTLEVSGTQNMTGTLNVDGPLEVDGNTALRGTTTATGTTRLDGTVTITGPTDISGNLTARGTTRLEGGLTVTGATALQSDLTVNGGGKIIVAGSAPVTLGIASNGFPGLQFPGGNLTAGSSSVAMQSGNAAIGVSSGQASMVVGSGGLGVNASGVSVTTITTTTSASNLFITTAGLLQKVTSAARYKVDPKPMSLPDELLAVPVKDWLDKGAHERGEATVRVPGIIAEEVEAAGGSQFVTYDEDGQIEGVAYDRLALARTEILARQLAEALEEIAELRRAIG